MSEQTANLCTTDACESLRARLAKYEDAEGRPLRIGLRYTSDGELAECPCCESLDVGGAHDTVNCYSCGLQITKPRPLQNAADAWNKRAALKAQPDPWQASGADWCSSIHSNPDAKAWADFFVAVFPGQADKHELMIGWFANAMMAMHDHLKAQPSGVVLPERLDIPHRDEFESADQYAAAVGEAKKWNACLDEVARLNSSPVSAGEPCKFLKDAERRLNAVLGYSEDFDDLLATVNTACLRIRRLEGSAGGVDERAAFEASGLKSAASIWKEGCYQYKTIDENGDEYFTAGLGLDNIKWEAWQARAALSAPSHGEQVRQMVPEGFRVMKPTSSIVRPGERWEIYAPCGSGGIVHEDDVTDWVVRKLLDAAAAPSAGSQEQGE